MTTAARRAAAIKMPPLGCNQECCVSTLIKLTKTGRKADKQTGNLRFRNEVVVNTDTHQDQETWWMSRVNRVWDIHWMPVVKLLFLIKCKVLN